MSEDYEEACTLLDEIETLWGDAMNVHEDIIARSSSIAALRSARNSLLTFQPEERRLSVSASPEVTP